MSETKQLQFLEGVKVLDLTRLLPGPTCTLLLANMGASVVKVEDTEQGDYTRWIPPLEGEMSYLFNFLNKGKRSITLDLKNEKNREIFYQVVKHYDVLIESYRPGITEKLGIDYNTLQAINPSLIYCSLTGYGQTGPNHQKAGHDINFLALNGLLDQIGLPGQPPVLPNFQIADLAGGALTAALQIVSALFHGQRKKGCYLDISMIDGLRPLMGVIESGAHHQFTFDRGEDILSGGSACYAVYETSDGRAMALGALEKKFWQKFCQTVGREDLITHHMLLGVKGKWVKSELDKIFKGKTQEEWKGVFEQVDCCCTPVLTLLESQQDPHMIFRLQNSSSFSFSSSPPSKSRAPKWGEHTYEVLHELGITTT